MTGFNLVTHRYDVNGEKPAYREHGGKLSHLVLGFLFLPSDQVLALSLR